MKLAYFSVLLSSLFGCVPELPRVAYTTYDQILAWNVAEVTTFKQSTEDIDKDELKIGQTCPVCKGHGALDYDMDGKLDAKCNKCKGDGKIDKEDVPGSIPFATSQVATSIAANLTRDEYNNKVRFSKIPVLIEASAVWCIPCLQMEPRVEAVVKELEGAVLKTQFDVDSDEVLKKHLKINNIPTLILYIDGRERSRLVGAYQEQQIRDWLRKLVPPKEK